MLAIKIFHLRDHNNGGLISPYDDSSYIDTNDNITEYIDNIFRIRFRIEKFGIGTIMGSGIYPNQYALSIIKDGNDYFFKYVWGTGSQIIPAILKEKKIYEVFINWYNIGAGPFIRFTIFNQYHQKEWSDVLDIVLGAITTADVGLGATISGGNPYEFFTGTLTFFDYESNLDRADERFRLVFYEKYDGGASSDKVYNFFTNPDADIINRQSDFWAPAAVDITNYLKKIDQIKVNQDSFRTQEFGDFSFSILNYFDIKPNDTIMVEIDNVKIGYFNVREVNPKRLGGNNYEIKIKAEDILMDLEKISARTFGARYFDTFTTEDHIWWSNYTPVDGWEYHWSGSKATSWYSIPYLFKLSVYLLQYDNVLGDVPVWVTSDNSPYKSSPTVTYEYNQLVFKLSELQILGGADDTAKMSDVFRQILLTCRLCYYFSDDRLYVKRINADTKIFNNDDVIDVFKEEDVYQGNYYRVNGESPGWAAASYDNVPLGFTIKDEIVENVDLILNFHIFYRDGTIAYEMSANPTYGVSFYQQLADILDEEFRGIKNFETVIARLFVSTTYFPSFFKKIDDFKKRISTIKQYKEA